MQANFTRGSASSATEATWLTRRFTSVRSVVTAMLLLCTLTGWAQSKISGRVIDDQGQPLPGVSVVVKNTTTGSVTDVEGRYTLNAPDKATALVFSFIGYLSQEIPLNGKSTIDVTLSTDVKSLNEVVVVGYGTQRKETITGSVVAVKGAELVKSPTTNLSNSLAGRLPGVTAVNRSGEPGADGSVIRIRGTNTLGNNSALVVVDGIPDRAGGLDRINPADIETISVLKDASAAIYGSRAANGVILITTKRGKSGKPQLSYSFNQGFAQPTVVPKLANAAQYAEMLNDLNVYELPVGEWSAATQAFRANGTYTRPDGTVRTAPYSPTDIQKYNDGSDPWGHPNTDWYKSTLKNWSPQSRHNLQLTGGSENFKYLASLGYQNQDAFYKNSATGYKQYDLRLNIDANINKYVHLALGVLGREEFRYYPTRGAGAIFRMQMRGKPNQPAFWPDGRPGPDIENGENPVVITTNATGYDRDRRDYFQSNGQLDILIPGVTGLKISGTAAVDKLLRNTKRWETPWTLYERGSGVDANGNPNLIASVRGPAEPRLTQGNNNQLNILLGAIGTYERKFGDHGLTALLGINRETINADDFNAYRRYFISPAIDQLFAGGALEQRVGQASGPPLTFNRARINYFSRLAYNYKDKYLFEFLSRYDGSDMFPQATRYGFFPGFMAGWVVSEENFWKNTSSVVNYFKVRASWGQLGNDQIYFPGTTNLATYQYLPTYGFNTYIINNAQQPTLSEARIPNPNITWEVANNADIGIEGQLFNGKIAFEFDYFNNLRTSILYPRNASIPRTTGLTLPPENIGKVRNSGFDGQINYNGQAGGVRFTVGINGGYAQNKIIFWDEAPGAPDWQRTTGKPINAYLAYQYDGVFASQAEIDANKLDYSAIVKTLRPGDMKYKDYDGDGKITPNDQVRNNRTNLPLFQGGLNLTANYKNFDLTVLFQGAAGAQQYISLNESGNIGNYLQEIYTDRWTVDNPSSVHPRIANRSDQYYSAGNTYWLRSADYIRLKNFEVGYTIPETFGKKIGIGSLRVYINALNALTLVNGLGSFDPETEASNGQYYPQSRIINGGLTLRF